MRAPRVGQSTTVSPMLSLDDFAAALSIARRTAERLKSAGKLPRPDLTIGRMPRWLPETVRRFMEGGGA